MADWNHWCFIVSLTKIIRSLDVFKESRRRVCRRLCPHFSRISGRNERTRWGRSAWRERVSVVQGRQGLKSILDWGKFRDIRRVLLIESKMWHHPT